MVYSLQLCEKFELLHVSQGQEKDRFIEVRKPQKESLPQAVPIESEMEKEDVDLVSDTAFVGKQGITIFHGICNIYT